MMAMERPAREWSIDGHHFNILQQFDGKAPKRLVIFTMREMDEYFWKPGGQTDRMFSGQRGIF
jgi:hypothetical protein